MKNTASKFFRVLCSIVAMLVLVTGIASVQVLAATNGIYLATASPHYKHPVTGAIEDSGGDGSAVLGQSMTESALYKQALVEVDPSGNTYLTVRLQLMDNIQNPQFQVSSGGSGGFSSVSASLMQEDYANYTADYRMQVPNENAILRCNMYVTAMGREVIFYITVSGLSSGSGDFITSVAVETPQAQTRDTPAPAAQAPASSAAESSSAVAAAAQPPSSAAPVVEESSTASSSASSSSALGLEEFDNSGSQVSSGTSSQSGKTKSGNLAIGWVAGGILAVLIAGGCVWYFCFFRKKK